MFEGANAFSVAIHLRLVDKVSPGLLGLASHFRTAEGSASRLQSRLVSIGKLAGVGMAMSGVGAGILGAFTPALREAQRFQTEAAKFSLYGMGDKANAEATRFAKSMGVIGSSYVDNMRLITEAQGIFRESGKLGLNAQLEGAKIAAPILAKLNFIESSLGPDQRAAAHTQDLAMLRFIEARGGANDPRTFAGIAEWGFKLSKSSGGVVPWSQLQQLAATSGVAGFNLSQDAIAKLEPVVADLTGGRTGSGLRVAFQRLLGTQRGLPVQAIQEFLKLGLWDPSKVQLKSGGGIKSFIGRPGEVLRDRALFATDPVEFYKRDFLPALAKRFGPAILGDSVQARTERAVETSLIFGPGTASAVFSQLDKLAPAIARSIAAQNKTLGIDPAYHAAQNTLGGQKRAAQKAFHDTLELTGEAVLPMATRAMKAILPALQSVNAFATIPRADVRWDHPGARRPRRGSGGGGHHHQPSGDGSGVEAAGQSLQGRGVRQGDRSDRPQAMPLLGYRARLRGEPDRSHSGGPRRARLCSLSRCGDTGTTLQARCSRGNLKDELGGFFSLGYPPAGAQLLEHDATPGKRQAGAGLD